ncbi:MAG: DNA cytosine methyltransferase [Candidatus Hodarchaeales archaeon]
MHQNTKKYNILSLFSGCGGLDLGFAQLGADTLDLEELNGLKRRPKGNKFELIWANDIYPPSAMSYANNFDAEIYKNPDEKYSGTHRVFRGDIADVPFEKAVGDTPINLVLGGFPCQDFSVIRGKDKRKGIKVKRGRLYLHFVRALGVLKPEMFVAENVKGLMSANGSAAYNRIIADFSNLKEVWDEIDDKFSKVITKEIDVNSLPGYYLLFKEVTKFVNFGTPQKRERLIILGVRKDLVDNKNLNLNDLLKKSDSYIRGENNVFSKYPLTPLETFNGDILSNLQDKYVRIMPDFFKYIYNFDTEKRREYYSNIVLNTSFYIWKDYLQLNEIEEPNCYELRLIINQAHEKVLKKLGYYDRPLEIGDKQRHFDDGSNKVSTRSSGVQERMYRIPPGENHLFVRGTEYKVSGLMSNIYKRIHPLVPAYTVIARGGGGTWGYHYAVNRGRMTNRERARLQTFPDTFMFKGKVGEVRRQIGEAVPPLASHEIAKLVYELMEKIVN